MEIIYFRDKTTNLTQKKEGLKVGDYLAVTQEADIFKINTGKKLFKSQFSDYGEALQVAQWLNQKYGKFFVLWERWENVNIFRLAQHSVDNGKKVLDVIDKIENGEITRFEEIKNEMS